MRLNLFFIVLIEYSILHWGHMIKLRAGAQDQVIILQYVAVIDEYTLVTPIDCGQLAAHRVYPALQRHGRIVVRVIVHAVDKHAVSQRVGQ